MFRAFNILIEVSNDKTPARNMLGSRKNLMNPSSTSNGYVARCIRQCLLSIDMVEPYIAVETVEGKNLAKDLKPLKKRNGRACQTSKVEEVSKSTSPVQIEFKVGGAITVDSTEIWYGKWDDVPSVSLNWNHGRRYNRKRHLFILRGRYSLQGFPRFVQVYSGRLVGRTGSDSCRFPLGRQTKQGDTQRRTSISHCQCQNECQLEINQQWKSHPRSIEVVFRSIDFDCDVTHQREQ